MTELVEWKKQVAEKQRILKIEEYELEKEILKNDLAEKIKRIDNAIKALKGE